MPSVRKVLTPRELFKGTLRNRHANTDSVPGAI